MNGFKIKVERPGKGAYHATVATFDLKMAECYAIDVLVLRSRPSIDYHFKMGYVPFLYSRKRTTNESHFEFYSRFLTPHRESIVVEIRKDETVTSKTPAYQRNLGIDIFHIWSPKLYEEQEQRRLAAAPQFFTKEDIAYFSSVAGRKYKAVNDEFIEVGNELRNRIYDKTKYWAELLRDYNYTVEFGYDWQKQKKIRNYSWARIFPTRKSPDVFFTVGVGSRFSETMGEVPGLVYKLDCQRDALEDQKQSEFDMYLSSAAPEIQRVEIPSSTFGEWNWEKLTQRTLDFLRANEHHYWTARRLVEGNTMPKQILARVCWNTNQWVYPSGPNGKSKQAKTHEKDRGFGFEEWMFDTTKQIGGYHYSFLQGFHKKGDHIGKVYDVRLCGLFDTGHGKKQYWIGRIRNVEVLTSRQAGYAMHEYKSRGWYKEMNDQLRVHGIDGFSFVEVSEEDMFNIRFEISSGVVERHSKPIPIEDEELIGNKHYTVMEVTVQQTKELDPFDGSQDAEDENDAPTLTTINASFQGQERTMKLLHFDIQKKVRRQLMAEFSGTDVKVKKEFDTGFGTFIDIVVKQVDGSLTLYEIKTAMTAVRCVREALGQLIEYCYYPSNKLGTSLVIVGPHRPDSTLRQYLSHLRSHLNLDLYYQWFNLDLNLLDSERI